MSGTADELVTNLVLLFDNPDEQFQLIDPFFEIAVTLLQHANLLFFLHKCILESFTHHIHGFFHVGRCNAFFFLVRRVECDELEGLKRESGLSCQRSTSVDVAPEGAPWWLLFVWFVAWAGAGRRDLVIGFAE